MLFEMATGTGKTRTAIACIQQELQDKIMARANGIAEEMTTGPSDDDANDAGAPNDDFE